MHRLVVAIIALLLAGCAAIEELRGMAPGVTGADEQLVFLDRLSTATPEELASIGTRLEADTDRRGRRSPIDSLRYALWQSTPAHAGYAPGEARERLSGLLENGHPPRALEALIRVQLRHLDHLRTRAVLEHENAQLTAGNGDLEQEIQALREQIQALTTLERRMGSGAGDESEQE